MIHYYLLESFSKKTPKSTSHLIRTAVIMRNENRKSKGGNVQRNQIVSVGSNGPFDMGGLNFQSKLLGN